jgi:deoxyhypusine monooxygenase
MIPPVAANKQILMSPTESLDNKYQALFNLRSIPSEESCAALRESYPHLGSSDFLKHDVMYILGQNQFPSSIDFLIKSMNDESESAVVRHEAAEALANFSDFKDKTIPELKKHWDSPVSELRSTVRLAIPKLEQFNPASNLFNKFMKGTIEPAEPFSAAQLAEYLASIGKTEDDLLDILVSPAVEEYIRYRVMYYLRDKADLQSAKTVARVLKKQYRTSTSPLMRHEVCFVMGQFNDKANDPEIRQILGDDITDQEEAPIVRHEAILAYSQIWGNDELIIAQKNDPNQLVNESANIVMNEELQH